jgi:hypothetical protein
MEPLEPHHSHHEGRSAASDAAGGSDHTSRPGAMGRIALESRALFDDLREWVDLRVQLIQVDVEERIQQAANEIMSIVLVMVLALFTMVFLLHGVAVWLGSLLGGLHWGYLMVGAFLGCVTWVVRRARPNHVKRIASLYRGPGPDSAPKTEDPLSLTGPAPEESAPGASSEESGGNERG